MSDTPPIQYHTIAEAAAILRKSPKSVWELCKDGKIPATKPTGTAAWLIPVDEFDAWVKAGANKAMSA